MATLYVENIPDDLYQAFPPESELPARRAYFNRLKEIHERPVPADAKFPSTEEMIREDRER